MRSPFTLVSVFLLLFAAIGLEATPRSVDPFIQNHLENFLTQRGRDPIASVMVIERRTGRVLAAVEGSKGHTWQNQQPTYHYPGFPAASLFKIVVAAAAVEVAKISIDEPLPHTSGCGSVAASGAWLQDLLFHKLNRTMTLRQAFAGSCNSFFARLAIEHLGLPTIHQYAKKFGWDSDPSAISNSDNVPSSPFDASDIGSTSIVHVGKLAAGFGRIGLSAIHAGYVGQIVANNGLISPLNLKSASEVAGPLVAQILPETANDIRQMMRDTTALRQGTAYGTFRQSRYRHLQKQVGGKTGTLNSLVPKGTTTWFVGVMPIDDPEIVVASVVLLEKMWHIRATDLAAEAFDVYLKARNNDSLSQGH